MSNPFEDAARGRDPAAIQFANDRPTALDDDLYQWAIDAEAYIRKLQAEVEALRDQLTTARNRLEDVLANDDGHAWKEASKFLEATQAQDTPKESK